jgi:hypothetical protein
VEVAILSHSRSTGWQPGARRPPAFAGHPAVELRQYGVKPTDGNVPRLQIIGAHVKEKLRNMQIDCQNYACEFGVDKPEIDEWTCP